MIHSNEPLPYAIEYAKSGRSNCKTCKKNIALDQLRMSMNRPSTFFDGNMDSWFHYNCFWIKMIRGRDDINISSIRGVDWLRWEDQEKLRQEIQHFKTASPPTLTPLCSTTTVILSTIKTEKSLSNRGKCGKCGQNFERGEIKAHNKGKANHFKCFLQEFDKISGTVEDIPGWADYEENFKIKAVGEYVEALAAKRRSTEPATPASASPTPPEAETPVLSAEGSPESSNKRPASSEIIEIDGEGNPDENDFAKKRRMKKEARLMEVQKKRMKKQSDLLWEYRQIFERMPYTDKISILRENEQDIPEGHDPTAQVIERLVDNALFGCPIICQTCSNGKIVYNSSCRTYVCTGYATEYSKCTYESKNPIRTPFEVSHRLTEKHKLQDIVFNQMSERLYIGEEDGESVVKIDKRKSKGGTRGEQFIYAAEAFDSTNNVPIKVGDLTSTNTHIIKKGTVVDAKFALADRCHVFKNEIDGSLYQATLSFTDLTQNKNSYYKIQLLKDDQRENYYVFRSWGRVGTEVGGNKHESYSNSNEAILKFQDVFHEKTKNDWIYRKHFRKMPGMFSYVETDYSEFAQITDTEITPGSKTLLPKSVKEVVMSIFDVENMKSALKSFEMDVNKMPLGRLSHNQINLAFEVLNDISDLLVKLPIDASRILDFSNKFYTIIPHNFGMRVPEPIDSFHKIKEKNNMLNALLDIKFAYDQISGGDVPASTSLGIDPVDINYQKLKCIMEPLQQGCDDWNMIHQYLKNTHGATHDLKVELIDILKLNRDNESSKFKRHIGNRRLLWHGSGKMNFAGILGQGLRIAPPEAPVSGYMFGKGVYFADMFSKSFFYCRANAKEEAYLLLCDVALGNVQQLMASKNVSRQTLPAGFQSVQGLGRQCPREIGSYNHPDGYTIPLGLTYMQLQGKQDVDYHLLYNEFIVYDVDQIQLKYLVRVKMHHARHL
ncbi:Poly [ADP-ribose] polymerase 1 [Caenorhabditis elegans]|uniref:Poly [ADP-ribose] polymerase 1 n=4 Tax=Caenorhabditis elegans TaxID=6239 RepID=PARP1_CAEEL|nr:Poly [ADP-ribose] polymerase 1 [Caenorhabditis elegans]Q9N4H4.1 RecName: Full=Poly [ADP-ribose] polymerase 1; AltName: Full=Poly ADP-ribose metabolism enzyme 1; AltName: Full=Protein poly-ADP-ribosyltransferase parp-1 [Caenorhabditis elegans]CCD73512.1 Poly [ADP-ribose] polymerase 1 [Caenorhabditis elegans]|eukprot:NP_491072.1 Poly [ADP-ribose] polymerase 1 [Caenorhabditis elegans]